MYVCIKVKVTFTDRLGFCKLCRWFCRAVRRSGVLRWGKSQVRTKSQGMLFICMNCMYVRMYVCAVCICGICDAC